MCSLTVMAPRVVGATSLAKIRPIAGLCAMRKVLCNFWLSSLPPLRHECSDCVCAEDTRESCFVLAAEGGRAVSRIAEINCGGAAVCEQGIRPCGTSSLMALIAAI